MSEFDVTIKIRIESEDMDEASEIAKLIVSDLIETGNEFVDRPINAAQLELITPAIVGAIGNAIG